MKNLILGLSLGCQIALAAGSDFPQGNSWFDEVEYWHELDLKRSDLMSDSSTCYSALTLKPQYRNQLLSGYQTPQGLINQNYTDIEKQADLNWIQDQQSGLINKGTELLALLAQDGFNVSGLSANDPTNLPFQTAMYSGLKLGVLNYAPAGYPLNGFVGYTVGAGAITDDRGLDYKVFLEFGDSQVDLFPRIYQDFSEALSNAGFHGDSKTPTDPLIPFQNRFQYNNVIIHSHSIQDAEIAERVALDIFGTNIVHMSRGVDVLKKADGTYIVPGITQGYDWHHFLCTGKFSLLPTDVRQYVEASKK
jgi:hypothetical protein